MHSSGPSGNSGWSLINDPAVTRYILDTSLGQLCVPGQQVTSMADDCSSLAAWQTGSEICFVSVLIFLSALQTGTPWTWGEEVAPGNSWVAVMIWALGWLGAGDRVAARISQLAPSGRKWWLPILCPYDGCLLSVPAVVAPVCFFFFLPIFPLGITNLCLVLILSVQLLLVSSFPLWGWVTDKWWQRYKDLSSNLFRWWAITENNSGPKLGLQEVIWACSESCLLHVIQAFLLPKSF